MTNKVEEAMTNYWGERCPDHEADCPTCQAWGDYDGESALWDAQLENYPDSVRCSRQEVMHTWILQGTTQFKAKATLQHGILNALLNNPIGVFYTCNYGQDYGYRYGTEGYEYYSFYVEA